MKKLIDMKGAIFDMDGTLIDSMSMWDNLASDYLIKKGITPEENLGIILKNMSMHQGAEYVIKKYQVTESTDEIILGINALIADKYEKELPAKEGVIELIEAFAAKKVNMCVATASDYHLADLCLTRIGIKKYFQEIYTCGNIGVGKDDPIFFEHVLEKLGTPRENTYVFEDSLYALETAKAAGFKVAAVYDEASRNETKALKEKADIYIATMKELL
jgi:HAD superfamily hydrolase (TIGR01509 family)